jgi:polar amino acid transport system substrate-binding protein
LVATIALASATPPVVNTVPVAPWTFPNDAKRGIAAEYLQYLFETAGIQVSHGTVPYIRAINGLRDGSNVAALLIPDSERDGFALRLCEVTTIRSGLLYKKARFKDLGLNDLAGLTVGLQRGTHALDKLSGFPGIKSYTVQSVEQGLRMLQIDRLDATFLSKPGSEIVLRDNGMAEEEYGWLEVDVAPVVVYISRAAPLARDGEAMARLRGVCEGAGRQVMKALVQKYR